MVQCMAARQELTEEDEIEQVDTMVNETGGDDDPVDAIDEEDDVSVCVGTQMSINWFKRKGTKSNPGPSDDDYLIKIDGELEKLGKEDFCRNSKNCDCLHILGDAHVRTPVAKFLLNFYKKPKIDRDNIVMTWFRYASRGGKERKHVYYLPFDNNDRSGDALDMNEYSWLVESTICTSAMMDLIQVKKGYMESMRASLRKIGVAKKNGNTGKRKGFKETDEVLIHLRLYFEELSKLGETRATRTVDSSSTGRWLLVIGQTMMTTSISQCQWDTDLVTQGTWMALGIKSSHATLAPTRLWQRIPTTNLTSCMCLSLPSTSGGRWSIHTLR